MFTLKVNHNDRIIINRFLTREECDSINDFGIGWVCKAFDKYIGLKIDSYRIGEFTTGNNEFLIYIRPKDLRKLRDNKLNELLG